MIKRLVLRLAISAILVLALAVPAFAQGKPEGTPKGQVEKGLDKARSICASSGLNDYDPEEPPGGQVQSYGQLVKQGIKAFLPSPGDACNPTKPQIEE